MDTPHPAVARPRFTLSALDWIAMLVVSFGGGIAYNFPSIPDRGELAAASFGTGLALAFMAWLAGRVQWASSGRVASGGRVAFRIALALLAGFAAFKGAERGNAQAQAQAAAAIAQVKESVTGLRRVLDTEPVDKIAAAFAAEVAAQRTRAAAADRAEREVRVAIAETTAEALAPQVEMTLAMLALRETEPLRIDRLADAAARTESLARARKLVTSSNEAIRALTDLPVRADARLVTPGVRLALRQWWGEQITTNQLQAWVAYGTAVENFYAGLESIDGEWSLTDGGQVRVDPQHVEAFKGWVAAHERAATALGITL